MTTVFPEKSYDSRKVLMMFGASPHHIGYPTSTASYASMSSKGFAILGLMPGSACSRELRLLLLVQSRSAVLYAGSASISYRSASIALLRVFARCLVSPDAEKYATRIFPFIRLESNSRLKAFPSDAVDSSNSRHR